MTKHMIHNEKMDKTMYVGGIHPVFDNIKMSINYYENDKLKKFNKTPKKYFSKKNREIINSKFGIQTSILQLRKYWDSICRQKQNYYNRIYDND